MLPSSIAGASPWRQDRRLEDVDEGACGGREVGPEEPLGRHRQPPRPLVVPPIMRSRPGDWRSLHPGHAGPRDVRTRSPSVRLIVDGAPTPADLGRCRPMSSESPNTPAAPLTTTGTRQVPDRVSLDGVETRWDEAWTAQDLYAFDRTATREQVYSIDTPPPTVSGLAARRPRVLLHAHRRRRPVPAHARPRGLLPDGLGRQRPAHRAPRAELLRRALRPVAAVRRPTSRRRSRAARASRVRRCRSAASNFVELCERLTVEDERLFEALWRRLGLSVDWSQTYQTVVRRVPRRRAAGVPAQPRARRGVPGRGARACGT